ncbi:MAG: MASE1 domain-containing protein, partial [Candidatus Sericytochromatia bacterium]
MFLSRFWGSGSSGASAWLRVGLLAVLYFFAARLGLLLAFENTNASPVWAPSGLALAALLLYGGRLWPGVFLGAFLANWISLSAQPNSSFASLVLASGLIAAGNTLEALI